MEQGVEPRGGARTATTWRAARSTVRERLDALLAVARRHRPPVHLDGDAQVAAPKLAAPRRTS